MQTFASIGTMLLFLFLVTMVIVQETSALHPSTHRYSINHRTTNIINTVSKEGIASIIDVSKYNIIAARKAVHCMSTPPGKDAPPSESGPRKGKKKVKDDVIEVNGRVVDSLPNAMFRVAIEPSKQVVLATISGKIRKNFVRILVGDTVVVELSAYDLTKGRITYRNK